MIFEIQGADGVYEVDAPNEKAAAAAFKKMGASKPGMLEDVAKSAISGIAKGLIGLAGLPSDLSELGARGIDVASRYVGDKVGVDVKPREPDQSPLFGGTDLRKRVEGVTGPLYDPKTTAGEYAGTIGEFAPAALLGPGGWAARTAQVVVPAVVSETAGQVTKGTAAEPYARFGGALAGGVGTSIVVRPRGANAAVREQLPAGVTPQMVTAAEQLIDEAAQQGIRLAWPEALSQVAGRPVLTNTMRHLEATPQTEARMAEFFGNRPQSIDNAARQNFDAVAPPNNAPSTIGPAVGEAAENAVNDVRGVINRATEPNYTAASTVRLSQPEMARVRALPGYDEARAAVRNDPQLNRYVANLPDDSVGFLNEVKKYLDTAAENAAAPVNQQRNMQRSAGYGMDAGDVRDAATRASGDYAYALQTQQQLRAQHLEPLLQGPLGKIAGKDTTTQKAINALFPTTPLANSADEIATTVGALAHRNPRAARDLVRAYLEGTFNEAAQALQSGANQAGGAKFRAVLVGNRQQAENLEAAVRALPNGDQIWPGFNRFLDVLEATGTRQNLGSRTAYNDQFLKNQAASGLMGETTKAIANPLQGGQTLVEKYERYLLGRNLNELADLLTNPNAAGRLRAIARMPVNSNQASTLALRLAAQAGASRETKPVD